MHRKIKKTFPQKLSSNFLDKKKRTESEALNDSGIADLSWEPEEEADKDLIERLNSLRLPQKPSNVAEKREKIITPIGDTYDLRDNENASYKPTDVLRMKLFYSVQFLGIFLAQN